MRPIQLHDGQAVYSTMAAMMFPLPEEVEQARLAVISLLAIGASPQELFPESERLRVALSSAIRPKFQDDLARRALEGSKAGEVVRTLVGLIAGHAKYASWNSAYRIVVSESGVAQGTSESALRSCVRRFAPALHLWAAWQMKGHGEGGAQAGEMRIAQFWHNAQAIRDWLERWRANQAKQVTIANDHLGPWVGAEDVWRHLALEPFCPEIPPRELIVRLGLRRAGRPPRA